MSLPTLHNALPARKLPVWGACLVIAALLTAISHAAPKAKTEKARGKKPTVQPLPPPQMDRNASRFILPENQKAYLDKMLSRMSMTKRSTDPFGRFQNPDAAPAPDNNDTPGTPGGRPGPQKQAASLQQLVARLKISTVIPPEKRFLIGSESYRVGETLPIAHHGKTIQVQVVSVASSKITFRNAASGETATLEMNLLPPGMQQGAAAPGPPGLFRNDKKAPINLDAP
jgi:hypothetical protein